jgi:hypothetical protein
MSREPARAVPPRHLSHFTAIEARQALLPGFTADNGPAAVDFSSVAYSTAPVAVLMEWIARCGSGKLEIMGRTARGILSLVN